jgi:hypothetical protein
MLKLIPYMYWIEHHEIVIYGIEGYQRRRGFEE